MMITYVGLFFVLPCIETYTKVDLRTITLDVPPQEVYHAAELLNTVSHRPLHDLSLKTCMLSLIL